jgi:hypothetical protein
MAIENVQRTSLASGVVGKPLRGQKGAPVLAIPVTLRFHPT